ncbi:hypothetical protein CRUP_015783 [Coryphaenoides rupestris]|nr:hypothetical protein CRUP_015783 [Coryphaenoides rupestris]
MLIASDSINKLATVNCLTLASYLPTPPTMGIIFTKLWRLFNHQEHKVIIVGLDNAGKTTILYQFSMNEVVHTSPTIGSNVEEIVVNNTHFLMWDIGGQESLRSSWNTYYTNTESLCSSLSEHKVIIVGLDNAGKTTILYQFSMNEVVHTSPTIGSNVEEIVVNNTHFLMWDIGGQESLRSSWNTYYTNTEFVIVVVDSTDRERVSVTKDELYRMLAHEDLKKAGLLIFANKQDVKGCMSVTEISQSLQLTSVKDHQWHIQACCALTGEGWVVPGPGVDDVTAACEMMDYRVSSVPSISFKLRLLRF